MKKTLSLVLSLLLVLVACAPVFADGEEKGDPCLKTRPRRIHKPSPRPVVSKSDVTYDDDVTQKTGDVVQETGDITVNVPVKIINPPQAAQAAAPVAPTCNTTTIQDGNKMRLAQICTDGRFTFLGTQSGGGGWSTGKKLAVVGGTAGGTVLVLCAVGFKGFCRARRGGVGVRTH